MVLTPSRRAAVAMNEFSAALARPHRPARPPTRTSRQCPGRAEVPRATALAEGTGDGAHNPHIQRRLPTPQIAPRPTYVKYLCKTFLATPTKQTRSNSNQHKS